MTRNPRRVRLSFTSWTAVALLVALTSQARAVIISVETVGNKGNASDAILWPTNNPTSSLFGAVAHDYKIGSTEVTNAQYVEFLNAKAKSDPLGLYNFNMGFDPRGGITQSGLSGSFVYAVRPNMGNKPVNFVSFFDSARFANWMHNGQANGSTETGSYTLLGNTSIPSNFNTVVRNAGATWVIPSENEWYKAAYYDPTLAGGVGGYWAFPTRSNANPSIAAANAVGDINPAGANRANYAMGADWNTLNGNLTTVGSAGALSESFYGTSDQGGNVWEWNDTILAGSLRGLRGSSWFFGDPGIMHRGARGQENAGVENDNVGFRLAVVPEPSSVVLALSACGLLLLARRRLK